MTSLLTDAWLLGMDWMDPQWLLDRYGAEMFWISLAIVFVECGLFFPFLPGDTLLFALGVFFATGDLTIFDGDPATHLAIASVLFTIAAVAGNATGYEIGRMMGPPLMQREGRILKRKYFEDTTAFFDKHGNKALVIGRFVPFVRTYITVIAGISGMNRRRFLFWSFIGALFWVIGVMVLGYFLGQQIPWLQHNIDYAIIAILAFSAIPVAFEWARHKRQQRRGETPHPTVPDLD